MLYYKKKKRWKTREQYIEQGQKWLENFYKKHNMGPPPFTKSDSIESDNLKSSDPEGESA